MSIKWRGFLNFHPCNKSHLQIWIMSIRPRRSYIRPYANYNINLWNIIELQNKMDGQNQKDTKMTIRNKTSYYYIFFQTLRSLRNNISWYITYLHQNYISMRTEDKKKKGKTIDLFSEGEFIPTGDGGCFPGIGIWTDSRAYIWWSVTSPFNFFMSAT